MAGSIAALAGLIDLDPAALSATIDRFNGFVRNGRDMKISGAARRLGRCSTPRNPTRPNRNGALGTIAKPPFYAAPYYRAILTTKGGPRTNERGQVLRADGQRDRRALLRLASPWPTRSAAKAVGAGTTIGPCLTWGHICGVNLLRENA